MNSATETMQGKILFFLVHVKMDDGICVTMVESCNVSSVDLKSAPPVATCGAPYAWVMVYKNTSTKGRLQPSLFT